jgi:tetratricopeptide (TPR) repeat protein
LFLIALLPTSLFPLAEVMNDHRTFLPYVGLIIAMAGIASLLLPQRINYNLLAKVAGGCPASRSLRDPYNELGQYDQAISACEQALRYKPDFALARKNLEFARQRMKPSVISALLKN